MDAPRNKLQADSSSPLTQSALADFRFQPELQFKAATPAGSPLKRTGQLNVNQWGSVRTWACVLVHTTGRPVVLSASHLGVRTEVASL